MKEVIKICPFCSGETEKVEVNYLYIGIDLGKHEVDKCKRCGEEIVGTDAQQEIQRAAEEAGVYWLGLGPKSFQKIYTDDRVQEAMFAEARGHK